MTNISNIITIIFTLLTVWCVVLTYSLTRMIYMYMKLHHRCRKEDVFQAVASLLFVAFSLTLLIFFPQYFTQYVSAFVMVCTGTIFTLVHFTEHLLFSCKALKKIQP